MNFNLNQPKRKMVLQVIFFVTNATKKEMLTSPAEEGLEVEIEVDLEEETEITIKEISTEEKDSKANF